MAFTMIEIRIYALRYFLSCILLACSTNALACSAPGDQLANPPIELVSSATSTV